MRRRDDLVLEIGGRPISCTDDRGRGTCMPPVLAADERALLPRHYFTIPYMLACGVVPGVIPSTDGRFSPVRDNYSGGYTGINQPGDTPDHDGTGVRYQQTGRYTSFCIDGYPLKDRVLRVRAIGIMPEASPLVPANYFIPPAAPTRPVCSLGGSAAAMGKPEHAMVPNPVSQQLAPAIVSSFFSSYLFQLALQDEQSTWLFGPQPMSVPGVGLYAGPLRLNKDPATGAPWVPAGVFIRRGQTPTNADTVLGRMVRLPYAIDVPPQQSRRGVASALWQFTLGTMQQGAGVWANPALFAKGPPICNGGDSWTVGPPLTTPNMLVQMFKVLLHGEPVIDERTGQQIRKIMCETGCDVQTAARLVPR